MTQVLIVDDDLMFRELLKDTLEFENIEADIATNGNQALNMINAVSPSIMVLDLKMPGISGDEIIRRVHAENLNKQMKIIVVTGHTDLGSVPEARLADATYTKPVSLEILIEQINKFLSADV